LYQSIVIVANFEIHGAYLFFDEADGFRENCWLVSIIRIAELKSIYVLPVWSRINNKQNNLSRSFCICHWYHEMFAFSVSEMTKLITIRSFP